MIITGINDTRDNEKNFEAESFFVFLEIMLGCSLHSHNETLLYVHLYKILRDKTLKSPGSYSAAKA